MGAPRHHCFEFEGENPYALSQQLQEQAFRLLKPLFSDEKYNRVRAVVSLHPIDPPAPRSKDAVRNTLFEARAKQCYET